ncbi:ubiquitin-conjugating enzyme/RWD-like protein [Tirmania nivea]|nr:ubiquitin-conjugating enzyme/RWD-like protein [Tirmania nivea]
MSSGSLRRITKELTELNENPPSGITASPISDSDVYKWNVTLTAPRGSLYYGGVFHLNLTLPSEYPFKPPTLNFTTKIYHPNVSNDDKGSMCLGILRAENWKPSCKILAVLEMARGLLMEPNVDDAVETNIAEQYKNDRAGFEKTVKQWVKNHAKEK